jgi:hypothetical protein
MEETRRLTQLAAVSLTTRDLDSYSRLTVSTFEEQAREHLTTATTIYREMGMTYWLERAERQ